VAALKFGGALAVADVMAAQITAGAPPGLLDGAALVPVPLPAARRRARGFDQAERLARALAGRTGAPVVPCLRRLGAAPRQTGAPARDRRTAGRIAVERSAPSPRHAVLVDDVLTTGATLHGCAVALRGGGTRTVAALTYARTLLRGHRGRG
jgi:predicted amidophosphoribosyltransferase